MNRREKRQAEIIPIKAAEIVKSEEAVFDATTLQNWLSFIDATPRTAATYSAAIKRFLARLTASGVTRPDRDFLIAYRNELETRCKPSTVQTNVIALRLFFRWLNQAGIYKNIADNLKAPKIDKEHKRDYLTGGQISGILAAIDTTKPDGARDYAIISLMSTTGLRVSSVVNADVGDLRPVGDSLALYYRGKGHNEKAAFVKIASPVEKALRVYLAGRGRLDSKSPLFTGLSHNSGGGRLTTRSLSRLVKSRFVAAGMNSDRLTAHSLRHSAATLLLLNGGTVEEARDLLNHSNINTTMIYSHAVDRAKSQAENKIAAAIQF